MTIRHLAAAVFLAAAGGCSFPRAKADPTQFFVLQAEAPELKPRLHRPVIELTDVDVPEYLKDPRLAARSGENRIDYAEFHRWAEPLAQGIARTLKDCLAGDADARTTPQPAPDFRLTVRVLAFEGRRLAGGKAAASVSASWELKPREGAPRRGNFIAPAADWDGKDYARLARLESDAISALCEELKRALAQ